MFGREGCKQMKVREMKEQKIKLIGKDERKYRKDEQFKLKWLDNKNKKKII